ncbi:MAG: tRNA 2-selenouridine(34) synthase MnmH [Endozoicomonas sp. (ex Botrylloides leachii)]|nr:tRNA 2-selenouridine(34) synthase MnmH [Endozoicomonas sp. (ex Botrylloides leachii)]
MKKKCTSISNYLSIFLNNMPLMDVRAPVEYKKGTFPNACNLPLLDDTQRAIIGTCYKKEGHEAAISLGNTLATDTIREQRIKSWEPFVSNNPNGCLFCFRGGERSHITQAWLKEAGYDYPLIEGGYKAMRSYLIEQLEQSISICNIIILSGKTGTGKTHVLNKLKGSIDLEGLANHRGSSFGGRVGGQPSQIDFENRLAIALLQHRYNLPSQPVILEDESKLIGRCSLPKLLHNKMQIAPIVLLEETIDYRIDLAIKEYVINNLNDLRQVSNADQALARLFENLKNNLLRIKKRLGGLKFKILNDMLDNAISQHKIHNDYCGYRPLIASLLLEYYDPMYDYQLAEKQGKIIYKGCSEAIVNNFSNITAKFFEQETVLK